MSLRRFSDIVPLKAETDESEDDKGYRNLEETHRGETGMEAAGAGRRRRRRRHRLQTKDDMTIDNHSLTTSFTLYSTTAKSHRARIVTSIAQLQAVLSYYNL